MRGKPTYFHHSGTFCISLTRLSARSMLSLALPLALFGCASTQLPDVPDIKEPALSLQARSAMLAQLPAVTATSISSEWWSVFADPLLTDFEAAAARDNLDLKEAGARIEQSRAQLGLVNSAAQPQLSAGAGYTNAGLSANSPLAMIGASPDGYNTWSAGFQAGWEIDLWGYQRQLGEAALDRLQAQTYVRDAARISLGAEVARAYLTVRGIQAQQQILVANIEIARSLLEMAGSRFRHGVASRFDVAAAEADLADLEAQEVVLRHSRNAQTNALAMLLARAPHEIDLRLGKGSLPSMPEKIPLGVSSELARGRPDILAAEARLRAAVASIGAARADFYPRISLKGSLALEAFTLSEMGSWDSRQYGIGPSLHLPIFDGGRLKSQLALSTAQQKEAALNYQKTVLKAWHEVDDALDSYASQTKRHDRLAKAADQSRTALEVAQRGYRAGSADFVRVLGARRALLASQANLADSATAAALSVVALYRSLGGGWSPTVTGGDAEMSRAESHQ